MYKKAWQIQQKYLQLCEKSVKINSIKYENGLLLDSGKTIFYYHSAYSMVIGYVFFWRFIMKIQRIINNNVVSCLDDRNNEVVVMGRGIGFQAKTGDLVNEATVEKTFVMADAKETQSLTDLLSTLPPEHIELCHQIIEYASSVLDKPLRENVYLTLTDHVSFAIEQYKQKKQMSNALLMEVEIFYQREFKVGKYALELIKDRFNIIFSDDEAASIALHLVNAEYGSSISETLHITSALHDARDILRMEGICIKEESAYYDEFMLALKFFVVRSFLEKSKGFSARKLVIDIKRLYTKEVLCIERIAERLKMLSNTVISDEDIAFLALQLYRVCQ